MGVARIEVGQGQDGEEEAWDRERSDVEVWREKCARIAGVEDGWRKGVWPLCSLRGRT